MTDFDARQPTGQQLLDAAVASRLAAAGTQVTQAAQPVPFGSTWKLDRDGRLARGPEGQPVVVDGVETLKTWATFALTVARGAHPSVHPSVGMEDPIGPIGRADPREGASDWADDALGTLGVHDRVASVADVSAQVDRDQGQVTVFYTLVLDTDQQVGLSSTVPLSYLTGGTGG